MNTLQKKKLRGTGVNCGLIVLLFAVVLLLGQVLPDQIGVEPLAQHGNLYLFHGASSFLSSGSV